MLKDEGPYIKINSLLPQVVLVHERAHVISRNHFQLPASFHNSRTTNTTKSRPQFSIRNFTLESTSVHFRFHESFGSWLLISKYFRLKQTLIKIKITFDSILGSILSTIERLSQLESILSTVKIEFNNSQSKNQFDPSQIDFRSLLESYIQFRLSSLKVESYPLNCH